MFDYFFLLFNSSNLKRAMKKSILLMALFGIFVLTGCAEKESESTTDNSTASTGSGDSDNDSDNDSGGGGGSSATGLVWNSGNWNEKNWQ